MRLATIVAVLSLVLLARSGAPTSAASPTSRPATDRSAVPVASPTYMPLAGDGPPRPAALSAGLIPDELRRAFNIHPFYQRCVVVRGIPIIGSAKVSDFAFLECAWTLDHLLDGRTMALDALRRAKVRVGILAVTQYTMDLPENQSPRMVARAAFNDRRSRGLGGLPLATCAEENLLNLRGDPYARENITIHEFAHTLASAIARANPDWYRNKLAGAYERAAQGGTYGRSYAISTQQEYWAEGAQAWFDCANPRNSGGAATRAQLKEKDPALAELLTEVYGDGPWRYRRTTDKARSPADAAHLAGLDRLQFPVFDFNKSPRIQAAAAAAAAAPGPK
jgi:alpha-glucosidase